MIPVLLASVVCFSLPASAATCPSLPTDKGTARVSFTVASAGTYRLWAHTYVPSSDASAFDLTIDNGCSITVGGSKLAAGTFSWIDSSSATPISLKLASGAHTLTIAGKDASVGIDRILLLASTSCVPTGSGSNCELSSNGTATTTTNTNTPAAQTPSQTTDTSSALPAATAPKQSSKKLSTVKLVAYVATATIVAALVGLAFARYVIRPNNVFKRSSLFKNKRQPHSTDGPSLVNTVPGAQIVDGSASPIVVSEPQSFVPSPGHKHIALFVLVFGIVGGLASFIALAATSYGITIDLSAATVSGQAKVVANANAINGRMVQFGSGTAATRPTTKTTTKPKAKATTPSTKTSKPLGTSPAPSSSTCANPAWSGSGAEDTDNTDPGDGHQYYWVNNDAWSGSHGPQTINVCNQSSWYAASNQPNNGSQVETYPDTEYDVGGRDNPSTKTIAQWSSITSTFSEAYPSAGSWDAAYDLWTDNWSNETMVWNQWAGTEDYWGSCAEPGSSQNDCVGSGGASKNSQAATIDGVAYHFLALGTNCSAANESSCEYIFFRDSQVASGSVDILAIYQWEVANGYAKSTDVPTQLEYGVEICSTSGTETFPMNGLTFTLK